MKKTYVLDTNVLLHDPMALFNFQDNNLVIPITVIAEIDRFKRDQSEVGRNARHVSRSIDDLRIKGVLTNGGVPIPGGGTIRIRLVTDEAEMLFASKLGQITSDDHRILAVALLAQREATAVGQKCIFVTKDTNLRILADAIGLTAEDYETDKIDISELYTGVTTLDITSDVLDAVHALGAVSAPDHLEIRPNQALILRDVSNSRKSALAIAKHADGRTTFVKAPDFSKTGVWGLRPRGAEQSLALALLLDMTVPLVALVGKAGTGKTLLALAAGLQKVSDDGAYRKLLVSRPVFPMGRDLGFLPGDIDEKLAPWMQPIYDNIDFLFDAPDDRDKKKTKGYKELALMGLLEVEPLTYIRGRSIPKQFMIVDEAQNLTPHEIKTIITRAGEGTKIVLTGDPHQIDNPYVDSESNGLSYAIERFKNSTLAGHVTLLRGERSPLAEEASNRL